ncbi:patatin-like phospholipase family protein [Persicobacter psychrovividus]
MEIGIALSGGGARGIVHIGVLQALEDYGITVNRISGTSMGAIIGAFYAQGLRPSEIMDIVTERKFVNMFRWRLLKTGLLPLDYLEQRLQEVIPHNSFEGLKLPLHVCVSNLTTGSSQIIDHGPLHLWIKASATIPVLFPPIMINDQQYVDGGLTNNLPVEPLLAHSARTIGVHVNHNMVLPKISGLKAIAERVYQLAVYQTVNPRMQACDLIIDPVDARKYGTFDFNRADELYEIGYKGTEDVLFQLTRNLDLDRMQELHQRKKSLTPESKALNSREQML